MRSPHIAPRPPHIATCGNGKFSAILANATEEGAMVNTEVKNIPVIKLAII